MFLAVLFFLLIGVAFIFLIIGMINPLFILRWSKNPTRLKVFGFWFVINFILWIFFVITIPSQTNIDKIMESRNYLDNGKYLKAKLNLSQIKESDSLYSKARKIINKADSLITIQEEEKENKKLEFEKVEREANILNQKEQLEREISSIKKGVDFSSYRGSIDSIQLELVLFGAWANIIEESEKYESKDIKKLTADLKRRVVKLQKIEFPKLRANYGKIFGKELWRSNIKVRVNGRGKKYINFAGGIFANNANKEDFHNKISEVLKLYRFKQARYRWYDGASEYTYWGLEPKKDSELMNFK
ncbi:hypothetical protein [uncultured Polaribacter sp.]|uniref:hypothetical protein n=1 Tax=uncultured Polaribacter sp. TaxID=174711 RepID=UPI00262CBF55|nr:hypothetical protein [uncultured Polaribacter sp.]